MTDGGMRSFWDEKASENPLWYTQSGLDYHAPDPDRFWRSGEEEVAEALSDAGVTGGGIAVDIGSGAGRLSRALAARFTEVRGFDVSPKMVEVAQRNLSGIQNVQIEAVPEDGTLPLPDGYADFVLSLQVFQHIPDRRVTLRYVEEAGRVLRPGCTFVFQMRTLRSAGAVAGTLERAARAALDRARRIRRKPAAGIDSPAWHGSRPGLWEVRRAAARGGMRVVKTRWISTQGASIQIVCERNA